MLQAGALATGDDHEADIITGRSGEVSPDRPV